ncbi:LysR family transcriptional regulator [Paraburkholderia ferrariae]|uniref:LysR family transcriptional regulator n=1 Tax=Paraburkholderia ferrariae TaxID=386056 RepID=UPI000693D59D|nr:LysR family transcriptional regulator [Paraburkholderia ferrariae]
MKDILSLRLYTRVARLGSFSAAAREWGMSQSQVSRIVADLESELGVRLLSRTTRAVVPTEAGAEFLARLDGILAALDDAQQSLREGADLRGTLRMSMPASIAVREVIPRLAPFAVQHPDLRIQMLVGDRPRDFVKEAVDVAFRLGRLGDSSATARLVTTIARFVVASPGYLAQNGTPATPDALNAHRIVGGPAADVSSAWIFSRGEEEVALDLEPHFWVNENEGAVAAAVAGLGITSTRRPDSCWLECSGSLL